MIKLGESVNVSFLTTLVMKLYLIKIRDIIVGKQEVEIEKNLAEIAIYLKYAPVTSVEVERSFSKLKNILSDKRLCLTTENVKKMLVISCNNV